MKNNKKGFTLAELLIVIAIMAILIAIAIPVFSAQLEKARDAVDASAQRSGMSMAESHYLLEHSTDHVAIEVTFIQDTNNNMEIGTCDVCGADLKPTITGGSPVTAKCTKTADLANGHVGTGTQLHVKVSAEGVCTPSWNAPAAP